MYSIEKPLAIGSDHAGYELRLKVIKYLEAKGIALKDYGTFSQESVDYPDYAHEIAKAIKQGDHNQGILICGTGVGISISANRHSHIRCALCWDPEIARLSRRHNDANVLALAGRFTQEKMAQKIIDAFFETEFEGGRHKIRVDKMNCS
jgi:ribose 5-phosphate isomerase B